MRVSTDGGRFGFILTWVAGDMFRFRIIVGGQSIGEDDPCILGSAMHRLGHLKRLDDARLRRLSVDPAEVFSVLRTDEMLHDAATLSLAESLDRWLIHGYVCQGDVTFLAQEYGNGELGGPILTSVVAESEYYSIFDAIHRYWKAAANGGSTPIDDLA